MFFFLQNVPEPILKNISGHIPQIQTVPKTLSDYSAEERANFPRLFEFPDDYIVPEKHVEAIKPKQEMWEWKGRKGYKTRYQM